MSFVRLLVKYRRSLDEKEFSSVKIYIIGGNADQLRDIDDRALQGGPPDMISLDEIRPC
jgi:hypothetical protein